MVIVDPLIIIRMTSCAYGVLVVIADDVMAGAWTRFGGAVCVGRSLMKGESL